MKKMISWVEIPAVNMERAVKFYNEVLCLNLNILDCGEEKMACFPGDEGAISLAPDFKPSKDGILVSLNVEERMDEALLLVQKCGGSVVKGKTKIEAEGRGYFALFLDSEGNRVGFYGSR
ncbi:MAG: VOC family protein [Bacteroidetes bacterium]|nr:VOC family protein [Bacteroidota bacterium]